MENSTPAEFVRSATPETKTVPSDSRGPLPLDARLQGKVGNLTIDPGMPLNVYDSTFPNPLLAMDDGAFKILYQADLVTAKKRISEIDSWLREDLLKAGYQLTVGSYREYVQSLHQQFGYSPKKTGIENLDKFYFYLKNFRKAKK